MTHKVRRRGFKLVDLVVVLLILVTLICLLIPAIQKVRVNGGGRTTCISQLKQLGNAAHYYHSANKKFPPGYDAANLSCLVYLLPYMENDTVYQDIKSAVTVDGTGGIWSGIAALTAVASTHIPTLVCPMDPVSPGTMLGSGSVLFADSSNAGPTLVTIGRAATTSGYGRTNYAGVAGVAGSGHVAGINATAGIDLSRFEGIFTKLSQTTIADILDGTSNALLFGEGLGGTLNPRDTQWTWMGVGSVSTWVGLTDGVKVASSASGFSSPHAGIVQFCLADGAVKQLRIGTTATAPFGTTGDWHILQQLAGIRHGTKVDNATTLVLN